MKKKVLFLTGTRADFGKIKPLIAKLNAHTCFEVHIFVTGMHELKLYGQTAQEVINCGYDNIHRFINQHIGEPMEMILSNTIVGLSRFVHENKFDMIIVHGDRVEALAGAIVGTMQNILVAHIEGGEKSGTVDEMIRHAVSKLAHIHFVANLEAKMRVFQMGEDKSSIHIIGSPDIDVMCSKTLPTLEQTKQHYGIEFPTYAIAMFHPVTTEIDFMREYAEQFVNALIQQSKETNFIVIYPNNDEGTRDILASYKKIQNHTSFKIFPSIRFENFLTLLKNTKFCIGNSSAGIREAPFYGIPTVNIGTRQNGRFHGETIVNTNYNTSDIVRGIQIALNIKKGSKTLHFGQGSSADSFVKIIEEPNFWDKNTQKRFLDHKMSHDNVVKKTLEAV